MTPTPTIRLFDAEPDLIRFLNPEDSELARDTLLPVQSIPKGDANLRTLFDQNGAFGAIVLDGLVQQSLKLGRHEGLRLLGPGDLVSLTDAPTSMLVLQANCRAQSPTRVALLGRDMLLAIRHWPQIAAGLHAHAGEQSERLVTQMVICQLPRVDERLLALMWLLAESWGQVTASGTLLPISLTHAALGGLIGARRPTVTLALGNLTNAGAIARQPRGWLLLGSPAALADAGHAHRRLLAPGS
jgi:CRP/FNR family transcriptional regulator, cyclic AMP receptor protein